MSSSDPPLQEQHSYATPLVTYPPANEYYPPYPAPYVNQQVVGMPVYQQPQVVVVQGQYYQRGNRRHTFFSTVRRVKLVFCIFVLVVFVFFIFFIIGFIVLS